MFNSFKKWIQTTVDTTTNSVLTLTPTTTIISETDVTPPTRIYRKYSGQNENINKNESEPLNIPNRLPSSLNLTSQPLFSTSSKTQPTTPNNMPPQNLPKSFSLPHAPKIESGIDLSHLSKEEQAHIASVLERAKTEETNEL
jgi:hypothetical protein